MGWVARTSGTDTITVTVAVTDIADSAAPPLTRQNKSCYAQLVLESRLGLRMVLRFKLDKIFLRAPLVFMERRAPLAPMDV